MKRVLLGGLLALTGAAQEGDVLEAVRDLLNAKRGEGAVEAARELLDPATALPALDALARWPVGPSRELREALVRSVHLRAELLRLASVAADGRARDLLVEQFARSLGQGDPWNTGVQAHRDEPEWLQPAGLRVRAFAPPECRPALLDLLILLRDRQLLRAPLVIPPQAWRALEEAPLGDLLLQPATWALERHLAGVGLRPVRLLRAIWILPETTHPDELPGDEFELRQHLLRREREEFQRALDQLREGEPLEASLVGGQLLAAAGIPALPVGSPSTAFDQGLWIAAVACRAVAPPAQGLPRPPAMGSGLARRFEYQARCRGLRGGGFARAGTPAAELAECRRRPALAQRTALEWLTAPRPGPLTPPVLVGLDAAALEQPRAVVRRMAEGRLPLWLLAESERRRAQPLAAVAGGESDAGVRRALLAGLQGRPLAADAPLAAQVAHELGAGGGARVERVAQVLLAAPPEVQTAVREVLHGYARGTLALELLRWFAASATARPWREEELQNFFEGVYAIVLGQLEANPVLAGRCKAELESAGLLGGPEVPAQAASRPLWAAVRRAAEELWRLGTAAAPGEYLVDLTGEGWLGH